MLSGLESFKAGFLTRCVEEGISTEEALSRIKTASDQLDVFEKQASVDPIDRAIKQAIWPFGKGQARTIPWDQSDLNKELWDAGKIYVDEDDDAPYYSHGSPLTKKLRLVDGMYRDFPGKGQFDPDHPRARDVETLELLARIKNIHGETAGPAYHSTDHETGQLQKILTQLKRPPQREKQADIPGYGAVKDLVKGIAGLAKPVVQKGLDLGTSAALFGPLALGGLAGYGVSKATDVDEEDVEDIKKQELIDEYKRQADRLRQSKALREYREHRKVSGGVYL